MIKNRAVFLDLNGTIVMPMKQETLEEMYLIAGADAAIQKLLSAGFVCPVVTVQARIEKGLFTEREFRVWFAEFFQKYHMNVKGPYICPHRFDHPCSCKKPNPLLYEQAAKELQLTLCESYVIGDSPEDIDAAIGFGGIGCLVRTGWAAEYSVVKEVQSKAHFIGPSIVEAAGWILTKEAEWSLNISGSPQTAYPPKRLALPGSGQDFPFRHKH
jgi:D-glycero-D-manno-heptose 1,7-bisphosphate phosphatase